jgi:hypothetical protein
MFNIEEKTYLKTYSDKGELVLSSIIEDTQASLSTAADPHISDFLSGLLETLRRCAPEDLLQLDFSDVLDDAEENPEG